MSIAEYLKRECIVVNPSSNDKDALIKELAERLLEHHPEVDRAEAMEALFEREKLMSTGIGEGVAIPHARIQSCSDVSMAFALQRKGVDFNALDSKPVKLVFLIFFPKEKVNLQLRTLAMVSRILQRGGLNKSLLKAESPEEVLDIFKKYEEAKHF
ncbi:MAG: PTS sugar transporter subunit IIA [SAR324 cluster bacterium]|nr:PTS sugar transporter subunit IIA [SAR324 cluster bacterium]